MLSPRRNCVEKEIVCKKNLFSRESNCKLHELSIKEVYYKERILSEDTISEESRRKH
jgi:hypothetical protein